MHSTAVPNRRFLPKRRLYRQRRNGSSRPAAAFSWNPGENMSTAAGCSWRPARFIPDCRQIPLRSFLRLWKYALCSVGVNVRHRQNPGAIAGDLIHIEQAVIGPAGCPQRQFIIDFFLQRQLPGRLAVRLFICLIEPFDAGWIGCLIIIFTESINCRLIIAHAWRQHKSAFWFKVIVSCTCALKIFCS